MRKTVKKVSWHGFRGQSANGLKDKLKCTLEQAKEYIDQFLAVYNDVNTFLWLLRWRVAITGQTETWAKRTRTLRPPLDGRGIAVPHFLLTYANGDRFWYDVSPIRPSLRTLTCFVHRIWEVRNESKPKLIYTDTHGRIGTRRYVSVDDATLLYQLPIRNLPWRSIRRVQKLDAAAMPVEEAKYEGLDATARYAISAVMQGGTADLTTSMMLHSRSVFQPVQRTTAVAGPRRIGRRVSARESRGVCTCLEGSSGNASTGLSGARSCRYEQRPTIRRLQVKRPQIGHYIKTRVTPARANTLYHYYITPQGTQFPVKFRHQRNTQLRITPNQRKCRYEL